jgi:hypothetical protein
MDSGTIRSAAQFENFVLELKLSPFELSQFQLVNCRIHEGFFNFIIQSLVALLKRGQMSFERHAELLVEVFACRIVCHRFSGLRRPSRQLGANFMKLAWRICGGGETAPALLETTGQPIFAHLFASDGLPASCGYQSPMVLTS